LIQNGYRRQIENSAGEQEARYAMEWIGRYLRGAGDVHSGTPPAAPPPTTVGAAPLYLVFPNPQKQGDGTIQTTSREYAEAYYRDIDPLNERDTAAKYKAKNGFDSGTGTQVTVVFGDVRDLGTGRRMTARQNLDGSVAFFVENYAVKLAADYAFNQANLDAAPEGAKGFFKGAMASINPYIAAGKFKPFDGSGDLAPGIKTVSTYGHTKGHTMYLVESKDQKLAVLGDLMHVAAVQFVNPSVTIEFDTDSKMAAVQRKKVYAEGAKQRFWLAVAHLPFPGIGHIRAEGQGYVYVPANYSVPR